MITTRCKRFTQNRIPHNCLSRYHRIERSRHCKTARHRHSHRRSFELAHIFIYLPLQLADLFQRSLRENGEVPGVLGKDFRSQRVDCAAQVFHLLNRLAELRFVANHNVSRSIPLVRPRSKRGNIQLLFEVTKQNKKTPIRLSLLKSRALIGEKERKVLTVFYPTLVIVDD